MIKPHRFRFYQYLVAAIKKKGCDVICVNGVEDHLHILISMHQSHVLSNIIGDVKRTTSIWIRENAIFPGFEKWQRGYGAFTVSYGHKAELIRYIQRQEEHHRTNSLFQEYTSMLDHAGIKYQPEYLWD